MVNYFDDFESGLREELVSILSASLDDRLNRCGVERGDVGMFEMTPSQMFEVMLGMTTDTVMFALRRYHEWTESTPR